MHMQIDPPLKPIKFTCAIACALMHNLALMRTHFRDDDNSRAASLAA